MKEDTSKAGNTDQKSEIEMINFISECDED